MVRRTARRPVRVRVSKPRPRPLDRLFRTALVLVPVGVALNVGLTLFTTDRRLLASLAAVPRAYLLLAAAMGLVPWFTNSLRLLIWTHFIGHPLPFRETFRINLATWLGSAATPTSSGGGLFKWGLLVQKGVKPGAAASLLSLEVLEDTAFFLIAIPLGLVLSSAWKLPVLRSLAAQLPGSVAPVLLAATLFVAGLGATVWLLFAGWLGAGMRRRGIRLTARVRRRLRGSVRDARRVYALIGRRGKSRFALTLSLTAVQWTARYGVVSALIAFLGAPTYPLLYFVLQWVIFTFLNFVPTPGASGGAEAAFLLVYAPFVPRRIIGIATAGWRFLTFYLQLTLGAAVFTLLNMRARRRE